MEQKQKDALWAQYTKQTHRLGRVLSLITVALLLGAWVWCGPSAAWRNF